ncbi:MAG TPA: Gfo/Idh/MocA family oxidoreductase [Longimicrobiaceae bacterium]|nr:Gfo/Idh/MocA family oxidoreductase [Longimicrobiaceae bacterium]
MSDPVRVGVIGVGSLGYHHARLLRDLPGAALAGVFDADPARLAQVEAELGVRGFASLDELLWSVDAAVVAVPTTAHAEVALAALDAGVHLLIEKPIASTLEEADAIVARAEERGLKVATGHVERFNGALRSCERYLEEPRFIESHRLAAFGPRGTDVAVVLDLMIHDIDLVLGLMGRPAESVDAVGVGVLTPSVDIANARLVFEGGAVANITASRVSLERMRKIRIFQRSGYISLDLAQGTGEFLRMKPGATLPEGDFTLLSLMSVVERIELKGDGTEPLRAELEAWVAALRGEGPLVVSGRDGRDALAVALRILEKIEDHAVTLAGTA